MVTFDPTTLANGSPSSITDFTGTYSYVIAPDNTAGGGNGTAISSPIWSWGNVAAPQPVVNAGLSPNLSIPTWGPGGSGNPFFDETTSTINLPSNYNNQVISGLTVNVNITDPLTPPGLGNDGDLFIELTAPNGNTAILYYKPGDTNQNFTNVTFSDQAAQSILLANGPYTNGTFQPSSPLTALNGSPVNGTYTLTIDNYQPTNSGTLVSWSISVDSTQLLIPQYTTNAQPLTGAAMDQNADGTSDQNPLTTPFTGLTPGDAYVAPNPQPTVPFTFNSTNILNPPFNQNTLPLIMPGPYVMATSAPNGTGSDNEVLNGTNSSLNVTFDQPVQTSTFTGGNVLSIMGPIGPITGPQSYPSDSTLQAIDRAGRPPVDADHPELRRHVQGQGPHGPVPRSTGLTSPRSFDGTFTVADITVQQSTRREHLRHRYSGDDPLNRFLVGDHDGQPHRLYPLVLGSRGH